MLHEHSTPSDQQQNMQGKHYMTEYLFKYLLKKCTIDEDLAHLLSVYISPKLLSF